MCVLSETIPPRPSGGGAGHSTQAVGMEEGPIPREERARTRSSEGWSHTVHEDATFDVISVMEYTYI